MDSNDQYCSSQDLAVILWLLCYQFAVVEYYWANYISSLWQEPCFKMAAAIWDLVKFSWAARSKIVVVSELWLKSIVKSTNLIAERVFDILSDLKNLRKKTPYVLIDVKGLLVGWVWSQNIAIHFICIQMWNIFVRPCLSRCWNGQQIPFCASLQFCPKWAGCSEL